MGRHARTRIQFFILCVDLSPGAERLTFRRARRHVVGSANFRVCAAIAQNSRSMALVPVPSLCQRRGSTFRSRVRWKQEAWHILGNPVPGPPAGLIPWPAVMPVTLHASSSTTSLSRFGLPDRMITIGPFCISRSAICQNQQGAKYLRSRRHFEPPT
jgi:hypothetical protein